MTYHANGAADAEGPSSAPTRNDTKSVVMVTDLDGSLCRTDTLHEAFLALFAQRPMALVSILGALGRGRAAFKHELAKIHVVPGADLPLNMQVIDHLRAVRAEGRRVVLVTAADQLQADAVAEATGLFDEVYGSDGKRNLKGAVKAAFLIDRFGERGFDYIGDSDADLPVWAQARQALTVAAAPALCRAAERTNADIKHLAPPIPKVPAMLRALRPHQWSKNLLLFLPLLAAHDISHLGAVFLGFLAFCLTASAVYVINDLLDLSVDRNHPRKSRRPFAAGDLTASRGVAMAAGLLLASLTLALLSGSLAFVGTLAVYLAATFLYSLWLKRKLLVDVLTLAGLYTIRIVAGGAVVGLSLSPWLLGFSMFLFLGLAAVKRQAELRNQLQTSRESSGRAYEVDDLPLLVALALSSGMAAVLVLALYIASDDVQPLYSSPEMLWLLCPIVLYWQMRMVMTAHRGRMTDDPIVFAATDRTSQITILLAGMLVMLAAFI